MEKQATHYAYINGIKHYYKLAFDLHTNIPRWLEVKDEVWHVVIGKMKLAGLTMVEIKK